MNKIHLCLFSLFITTSFVSANASIQNFSVDKSLYYDGDSIIVSGKVDYDPAIPSIILQIITPDGNGLAHIANIIPKNDGTFSKLIHAGGPTWPEDGTYTIKMSYGGNLEKTLKYKQSFEYSPSATPLPPKTSLPDNAETNSSDDTQIPKKPKTPEFPITSEINHVQFFENPKMSIPGYPSFDKPPQYYIDRYNNEPAYHDWFDSQFPEYTIDEVVGYGVTHIENFPSFDKPPQYYIDRYNNEPAYHDWFDSQFPKKTIYDVLGFSIYIPEWIKTYAKNWASGEISDREFVIGLEFMLNNRIIVIPNFDYSIQQSIDDVPSWFRNTAYWWASDLISQQEFINSIKYLIQEDIILIE